MAIELTERSRAIVSEMVAKGHFASEREVIEKGILLVWEEELRASIQEGHAAIARGEGYEMTEEFWDELIRESDELDEIEGYTNANLTQG
jgi:Arc/MetJ-type ribon-helix-helix transcriptional regulator